MESDAQNIRERAYRMDPSLRKASKPKQAAPASLEPLPILNEQAPAKAKSTKKAASPAPVATTAADKPTKAAKKSKVA